MPLFRALAKNMAASYFVKNYLTVFPQKWAGIFSSTFLLPVYGSKYSIFN
jgi:hypothetical protein